MKITQSCETSQGLTIRVGWSLSYIDQFLDMNCAPDLLGLKLFPNAKEISESMAAFTAARKLLKAPSFGDTTIKLVDVACGATPRTAALFAHLTRWQTNAVDPNLKNKGRFSRVRGLELFQSKIENVFFEHDGLVVTTMVHAHVKPAVVIKSINAPKVAIISIECCVCQSTDEFPGYEIRKYFEYDDFSCLSPKRTTRVWLLERKQNGPL